MKKSRILIFMIILVLIVAGCKDRKTNTEGDLALKDTEVEKENLGETRHEDQDTRLDKFRDLRKKSDDFKEEMKSKYTIKAEFNETEKVLSANQEIEYYNSEIEDLQVLYLHLHGNAFQDIASLPMMEPLSSEEESEFEPGNVDIFKVQINGHEVDPIYEGIGDTLLKIDLNNPLKPGEKANINLVYDVKLPRLKDKFGYADGVYNFANWYPVMSVYDGDGWNLDEYHSVGDPFYSDTSDYHVTLTTAKDFVIAASSETRKETSIQDMTNHEFLIDNVRDFAFFMSKDFKMNERIIGDLKVRSYYFEDHETYGKSQALDNAVDTMRIFNDTFGIYPYKTVSVVETYHPSGMEYPGVVLISDGFYNEKNKYLLEMVIVHELGHQWFYSVVGNDQIDESWLDESMTTFTEFVYLEKMYGNSVAEEHIDRNRLSYQSRRGLIEDFRLLKPLNEFDSWSDYGALVYRRGALMMNALRQELGDDMFFDIMKSYYENNQFKNVTSFDFIDIVNQMTGKSYDEFFMKWLWTVDNNKVLN